MTPAQLILAVVLAQSGSPAPPAVQPGVLPAGTGERERALWTGMIAAMGAGDGRGPVTAFDLDFDGTLYSGEKQSNDFDARYLYLEPSFVRMVLKSGRERLRGPEGEFVVEKGLGHRLSGREFAEDRRELEESLTVSRTFVGLSDPSRVRVLKLLAQAAPPPALPTPLGPQAGGLEWISVWSPDFRGRASSAAPPASDRIEIGLERTSHRPLLALLTDEKDKRATFLVRLEGFRAVDGFQVPHHITTWRVDPESPESALAEKPALELWLEKGSLRPQLTAEDFRPPR